MINGLNVCYMQMLHFVICYWNPSNVIQMLHLKTLNNKLNMQAAPPS